jgi:TolB-like protein/DNA-binding winged helix-turn-helix (wHTH) protein/Flp pilus assembly protein TadD
MTAPIVPRRAKFGGFVADFDSFELRKHGIRLKLQDQPFQILKLLLQRPGELVTRDQLRMELWTESTFVDFDAGLNAAIRRLRDALNDSADEPRYIETLPRHGYRFIAVVEIVKDVAPPAPAGICVAPNSNGEVHAKPVPPLAERDAGAFKQPERPGGSWKWRLAVACALLLTVGVGTIAWHSRVLAKRASGDGRYSIAVLPLQNLTGDPQRDFFVDGVTETLVTELAQIHSLRISLRSSPSPLKYTPLPVREMAKQLDADAVLEGAVLQSGSRVRISVRLMEAEPERCRWAKEYDRDAGDILNLQSEIAKTIAAEIPVQIRPAEEGRLRDDHSVNPDAYAAYLEGQYLWRKRTLKSLHSSIEYFQQAVRLDPAWGRGYAGLAEAYAMLGYGVMVDLPPDEAATKARAFALKAAELDPTLATPHAVLGLIKHRHDWDWGGAAAEFQRAIHLDPSYATAHYWYSNYFLTLSRQEEEKAELEVARHLDPTYPVVYSALAFNLDRSGHLEEARSLWNHAIGLEEANWIPHYDLARSYEQSGQYEDAIQEFSRVLELSEGNLRIRALLARLYAVTGRDAEARAILREIHGKPNSAFSEAEVYVALGEREQALRHLRAAARERCGWLVFVKSLPTLDPIRSDPQFEELIAQIKFPSDEPWLHAHR